MIILCYFMKRYRIFLMVMTYENDRRETQGVIRDKQA